LLNAGALDPSFNADGVVFGDFGSGTPLGWNTVVQADGKVITAGDEYTSASPDFGMTRFNTDGSLDTSFGTGGHVISHFGDDSAVNFGAGRFQVALGSDGAIVVVGEARRNGQSVPVLARYTSDGQLDSTFG